MRIALCGAVAPPASTDTRAIAQMLSHLRLVVGSSGCALTAYQLALQRSVFG